MIHLNPMTGQRTDLEVTREDGLQAEERHARWRRTRIAYLEGLLTTCSAEAGAIYRRELAAMKEEA